MKFLKESMEALEPTSLWRKKEREAFGALWFKWCQTELVIASTL
jgi:hypothetical protein